VKCSIHLDDITLSGHAIGGGFAQIIHLVHSSKPISLTFSNENEQIMPVLSDWLSNLVIKSMDAFKVTLLGLDYLQPHFTNVEISVTMSSNGIPNAVNNVFSYWPIRQFPWSKYIIICSLFYRSPRCGFHLFLEWRSDNFLAFKSGRNLFLIQVTSQLVLMRLTRVVPTSSTPCER